MIKPVTPVIKLKKQSPAVQLMKLKMSAKGDDTPPNQRAYFTIAFGLQLGKSLATQPIYFHQVACFDLGLAAGKNH